jgi:enoyl-CoA hydratase/carnithine racemase
MTGQHLFTIPIAPIPSHPGGSIACTEPAPAVYLLSFDSPPDNRLTTPFVAALLTALDRIELSPTLPPGVVVTTSSQPKFYSNGLDLAHATGTPGFWTASLYALFRRLLTYPMPTLALVNGHAFAGGLMLAMHHDYRVQSAARGFVCLNELAFGAPLKAPMSSIFRQKVPAPAYRDLVLEARRFGGPAALEAGIVDAVGGLDEALALVAARGLVEKGRTGVYGLLKAEMWRESRDFLENYDREEVVAERFVTAEEERKEAARRTVEEMEAKEKGRAKL